MKLVRATLLLFTLTLIIFLTSAPVHDAAAASPAFSSVWIDPVKTCCVAPGPGSQITISVRLNLTASDSFSFFDVKLNYTTIGSDGRLDYNPFDFKKVVQPTPRNGTIDDSNGIFHTGFIGWECIDGVALVGICPGDDANVGQIRFEEFNPGSDLKNGPFTNLLLFTVRFNVTGTGAALFKLAFVRIVNPTGPNLLTPVVQDIPVVTGDAVFGNNGVVAFFNSRPLNPPPPTFLPNQPVVFDASGSFNATVATGQITSYSWRFGDGSSLPPQSVPMATHRFGVPGTYNVALNVTSQNRKNGTIIMPIVVQPALGGLDIQVNNQMGSPLRGNVRVELFNSTILPAPFLNRTVNQVGGVVFKSLKPDSYLLKFSGPTISNYSKTENVAAGWTTQDTVYVFESFSPPFRPSPNYGEIIFVGSMVAALGVFAAIILLRRRSSARKVLRANRPLIPKTARSRKESSR